MARKLPGEALLRLRGFNSSAILNELRLHAPLSRAELAARTNLTRSTVSSIVAQLLDEELVIETELQTERIGRPGMCLKLNPDGGCAVGIDIGIDFIKVAVADLFAQVLWSSTRKLPEHPSQQVYVDQLLSVTREAVAFATTRGTRLFGIGVAVPGWVDYRQREVSLPFNLPWPAPPFFPILSDAFKLPVFVENDANAAAVAEYYFGVAKEIDNFCYIFLSGIGLGAGLFINGKLFRGHNGGAGEIAPVLIDPHSSPFDPVERPGAWESMISPSRIARRLAETGTYSFAEEDSSIEGVSLADLVHATEQGQQGAATVLQESMFVLAVGIVNLIHVLNPESIVLGGDLSHIGEPLKQRLMETIIELTDQQPLRKVSIELSRYGLDASLIGAATLVLDDVLSGQEDIDSSLFTVS